MLELEWPPPSPGEKCTGCKVASGGSRGGERVSSVPMLAVVAAGTTGKDACAFGEGAGGGDDRDCVDGACGAGDAGGVEGASGVDGACGVDGAGDACGVDGAGGVDGA